MAAALRGLRAFAHLPTDEVARFVAMCPARRFAAGEAIMAEGVRGQTMLLLLEGQLAIWLTVGSRIERVATLSAGEVVGEGALFGRGSRSARVTVDSAALCLEVGPTFFAIRGDPLVVALERHLLETLDRRIRLMNQVAQDRAPTSLQRAR